MNKDNSMKSWYDEKQKSKYSPDKSIDNPDIHRCTDVEKSWFVFEVIVWSLIAFLVLMACVELGVFDK